ncbi:MAG: type II secretion system protein, partial [Verrucomicrobiaceae bacterium]
MKRNSSSAFTLIEMLTVMAIIAVIASLVVGVSGLVQSKAARSRAEGEIAAISAAIENYKAENGIVPRNDDTDELDPRTDANPTAKKYEKASLHLYEELSGDNGVGPDGAPIGTKADGKIDGKFYYEFKPDVLNAKKENGKIKEVENIQDPYGNCYGYSTAGLAAEQEFLKKVRKSGASAS